MKVEKTIHKKKSLLTEEDIYLFNEGSHFRMYDKFGAHIVGSGKKTGTFFSVWAPDAEKVSITGDFNGWNKSEHLLKPRGTSGIWEGFFSDVSRGDKYKYFIHSRYKGYKVEKTDPFAVFNEIPTGNASIVWGLEYNWGDSEWMASRGRYNDRTAPISIYEVHVGSWMRANDDGKRFMSYRELAPKLAQYAKDLGFTHVELLPVMEHPFYGSWGYQTLGYFSPTSRYGQPQDFMYLVDTLHKNGIGVILDWVPSHFPNDEHGLGFFDGTHLYEHEDPKKRIHPDWDSLIFNYGRNEVQSFLISSAIFWLDKYHVDGLRVDAVASMLYLDYGRKEGEWSPNEHGGRENLEAVGFLRRLNEAVYKNFPDVQTIAEESTAWPMVSRPTYMGGLGFGMKWDMGWMNDTLEYISNDPVHRKYHYNKLTFRMIYAFSENFILPLSHDEVVHGKGSLLNKMPGDEWQKFANLRLLLSYMYAQPGKKLLFMGGEFGQWNEWYHESDLDWGLLDNSMNAGLMYLVRDLNKTYRNERALHDNDFEAYGFEWIDCNDSQQSTISFIRKGKSKKDIMLTAFNFTPIPRSDYRIGVPEGKKWLEILNSDASVYGGSGAGNFGSTKASKDSFHGRPFSINITLPPLAAVYFKLE
ncbi:1,4-alpha-glucan branching protein GlgB [Thermodesulfobacteriota bacterium]